MVESDVIYEKVLIKEQRARNRTLIELAGTSLLLPNMKQNQKEDLYNSIYVEMSVADKLTNGSNNGLINFENDQLESEYSINQPVNRFSDVFDSPKQIPIYADSEMQNFESKIIEPEDSLYTNQQENPMKERMFSLPGQQERPQPFKKRQSDSSITYSSNLRQLVNDLSNTEIALQRQRSMQIQNFKRQHSNQFNNHKRQSSSSSSEGSQGKTSSLKYISRSVDNLGSRIEDEEETIYAEIVSNNTIKETSNSRQTRQSDNPILQQSLKENSLKRVASLNSVKSQSLSNGYYGTVSHNSLTDIKTRTSEKPQTRIKSKYENVLLRDKSISDTRETDELYENASNKKPARLRHRHSLYNYTEHIEEYGEFKAYETNTMPKTNRLSFYENASTPEIYGNGSETAGRMRSTSRPIDIERIFTSGVESELVYSHIDIIKKQSPPSQRQESCSSIPSSPRGSTCSSMSSELSSPPPLPSARKSIMRMGSWSNFNNYASGQSYIPANYLGRHLVTKINHEVIDTAISHVAQHTNVLEMKPVHAEITNDFLRFGTTASPWELIVQFAMEEIISVEVILKNAFFIGIIAGKPSEDAYCYVLQSDKCNEIADAIKAVLKSNVTAKISRSQSHYDIRPGSIPPERQRFHFLVKVGTIKVKKSFHGINDYIRMILEKVNPKDFRSVNLEISGANIIVTDTKSEEEEDRHCTSWVLSLGLFDDDMRYFGYIISGMSSNNKAKINCHVYRAARDFTALNIVETIKASMDQAASLPRKTSNTEINPIYTRKISEDDGIVNSLYSKQISENERLPSVCTSGYGSASISSFSTPSTSPETFNRTFSSSTDDSTNNTMGSTETLLTLTPSHNSSSNLVRSSDVINEQHYTFESSLLFDDDREKMYQQVSPSKVTPVNSPAEHKNKGKHKNLLGKLKQSIKHKKQPQSIVNGIYSDPIKSENNLIGESGLYHFNVTYICSTVINSPLKHKHVRDCYKQYTKEINKHAKNASDGKAKIGGAVSLQVISKEGVSMLDPSKSNFLIKSYSLDIYDSFIQHPEESKCFAFSTTAPGNNKLKCHLFTCSDENPLEIEKAFRSVHQMKVEMERNQKELSL